MKRPAMRLALVLAALCLVGCSSVKSGQIATFNWTSPAKRILLDQSNVQLGVLKVGGHFEPRADWTDQARTSIAKAATEHLAKKDVELVSADDMTNRSRQELHDQYAADYELVLSIQDSYSSTGRVALNAGKVVLDAALVAVYAVGAAAGGGSAVGPLIPVQGGALDGSASLIDLRSGVTIWTRKIESDSTRSEGSARHMIDKLLKDVKP